MLTAIHTHLLADDIRTGELTGSVSIVVDVLRASSTIVTALSNGAEAVIPCRTVDETNAIAEQNPDMLRGGERHGVLIDGFNFSNSPADYLATALSGRSVAFTTTNGTRALLRCAGADRVFIGCFLNLGHLERSLRSCQRPLHIVCAGTTGQVTGEDVLFAGALTRRILDSGLPPPVLTDATQIALGFFDAGRDRSLAQRLQATQGGRNLTDLGLASDIAFVSQTDSVSLLAEFLPNERRIVAS